MNPHELERRLAEQQTLLDLGLALAETLEPLRVLELAMEKAEEFCGAAASSIWELDGDAGELFFRLVRGGAAPAIKDLRVRLGDGIVGDVAATGVAERIDGRGYSDGLAGDALPRLARIVAVADTYDAITTTRPYREGLPLRAADEIRGDAGTRLCPQVVGAFERLFRGGRFSVEIGESLPARLAGSEVARVGR